MLVDKTEYLSAGIHIGMKSCTKYMKQFVYKIREDGLAVFNLQEVDNRIKTAVDFLSTFDKILVVSNKQTAFQAAKKFAEVTENRSITGRFSPGTLTNPSYKFFCEPDVIVVVDPLIDKQVIEEARKRRVPIVALCDTFNEASDIDLVVPINNNGKKSLALVFWIFARELLKKKKKLKKDSDFKLTLKDFGDDSKPKPKPVDKKEEEIDV